MKYYIYVENTNLLKFFYDFRFSQHSKIPTKELFKMRIDHVYIENWIL